MVQHAVRGWREFTGTHDTIRGANGWGKPSHLPIGEAIRILLDVARALAYAHERGSVHRDIKPDNVLLSGGSAMVADFGIAKALDAAKLATPGNTLLQLGTSIGTPAYMAPEPAAGDPGVDHRADIYSFGCMAYELLAGRSLFRDRTPQQLFAAHMVETPEPIAAARQDAPAVLAGRRHSVPRQGAGGSAAVSGRGCRDARVRA